MPTSTSAHAYAFRPEVEIQGQSTRALCDQLAAVDPQLRLGEQVGYLGLAEMQEIDQMIALLLDLRLRS